jgi:hypothetical protein
MSHVGTFEKCRYVRPASVIRTEADVRQRLWFYLFTPHDATIRKVARDHVAPQNVSVFEFKLPFG